MEAGGVNILNRLKYIALSGVLLLGVCFNGIIFAADKIPVESMHTYSIPSVQVIQHDIPATVFKQNVRAQIFLPPNYSHTSNVRYSSLYVNDGQDAEAVALAASLQQLYAEQKISPVIVIAVSMLPDRMGTYGFSDRAKQFSLVAETKYGSVGSRAHEYSEWVAMELVPYIDSHYRTITKPEARTILGWSLGAANAFNIAWNYPDIFSRVGGFSPSFWLSAKSGDMSQSLAIKLINSKALPIHFSVWLAAGTAEETDDRDSNGVIDVLDDSQAVIAALKAKILPAKKNKLEVNFQLKAYKDGQHNQASWKVMLPDFLRWAYPIIAMPKPSIGEVQRIIKLPSQFINSRDVDVWLPPGYSTKQKYAVLYMHDGQMLFDADITWNKQEWQVDEVAAKLMAEGSVRPFIVVGVHNVGSTRHSDYFPQKPFESLPQATRSELMKSSRNASQALFGGEIASDAYLKFLVDELKPYIDRNFSVYTDAKNTAIMGSSMGGLISLYAISEYPQVYGSAACMSTHWPGVVPSAATPVPDAFFAYMKQDLPDPAKHRLYFDYGTETLDAFYPPLQAKADLVIQTKGYNSSNWQTREFIGAEHSEKAWAARLDIPLQFLFGVVK